MSENHQFSTYDHLSFVQNFGLKCYCRINKSNKLFLIGIIIIFLSPARFAATRRNVVKCTVWSIATSGVRNANGRRHAVGLVTDVAPKSTRAPRHWSWTKSPTLRAAVYSFPHSLEPRTDLSPLKSFGIEKWLFSGGTNIHLLSCASE